MAKSINFFGLREGSTKSHTYSTYHGKQITKARVSKINDPKTRQQIIVRIKFSLLSFLYAQLKEFLKISMSNEKDIRKAFFELNKNCPVYSYPKKGNSTSSMAYVILSHGNLPITLPKYFSWLKINYIDPTTSINKEGKIISEQAYENIKNAFQCQEGQTILLLSFGSRRDDNAKVNLPLAPSWHTMTFDGSHDGIFLPGWTWDNGENLVMDNYELHCIDDIELSWGKKGYITSFASYVKMQNGQFSTSYLFRTHILNNVVSLEQAILTYTDKNTSAKYLNGGNEISMIGNL